MLGWVGWVGLGWVGLGLNRVGSICIGSPKVAKPSTVSTATVTVTLHSALRYNKLERLSLAKTCSLAWYFKGFGAFSLPFTMERLYSLY